MPPRRRIPDSLAPELVRLYEEEEYATEAIVEWLKSEYSLDACVQTVRRAIYRHKAQLDLQVPIESTSDQVEPGDPEDALHRLRHQLARDAHVARLRVIRYPDDANAGRLYLGLQSLRVRVLVALKGGGRGMRPSKADAAAEAAAGAAPKQPVARFVVGGKPVMPS